MRTLSSTYTASKKLLVLQLLCWCCFFALPAINAQGQVSGYWVSLCTTAGIELVKIESSKSDSKQHQTTQCPCVQDVISLSFPEFLAPSNLTSTSLVRYASQVSLKKPYTLAHPRAPPSRIEFYLLQSA
ncbi:hypothetical protein [Marinomonas sp. PE14-40]|uniref:hypothetical protein n=1 Tax=Marinomonas sp. PE14-40 TaxID=3060621 RepID=UPI003F673E8E